MHLYAFSLAFIYLSFLKTHTNVINTCINSGGNAITRRAINHHPNRAPATVTIIHRDIKLLSKFT